MLHLILNQTLFGLSPVGADLRLMAKPIKSSWVSADRKMADVGILLQKTERSNVEMFIFWVCGPDWPEPMVVGTFVDIFRRPVQAPHLAVRIESLAELEKVGFNLPELAKQIARQLTEAAENYRKHKGAHEKVEHCLAVTGQLTAAVEEFESKKQKKHSKSPKPKP